MNKLKLSIIAITGKYTGLVMALLLLNLTALADDLNSLSFDNTSGYSAAQNSVKSSGMCEMIADNDLNFSNSVPGHQEKSQCPGTIKTGKVAGSQSGLKDNCSSVFQYGEQDHIPQGCPEYNLILNNSPPIFL